MPSCGTVSKSYVQSAMGSVSRMPQAHCGMSVYDDLRYRTGPPMQARH